MSERRRITVDSWVNGQSVEFEAWPEHGAWYEVGHADEVGALMIPMLVNGEPDTLDDGSVNLVEIEVKHEAWEYPA